MQVEPLTPCLGAVVSGVRVGGDLGPTVVGRIRAALLRHRVLFFRDQTDLDDEGHTAFAQQFGSLAVAHPVFAGGDPAVHVFELDYREGGRADHWHTDLTYTRQPALGSVLRAVILPDVGGDTLWADTAAAYRTLTPEMRSFVEHLWVQHTNFKDLTLTREESSPFTHPSEYATSVYVTRHPMVRVHPETGERCLVLGGFARRVPSLAPVESRNLLDSLARHVEAPERTLRWRWRPGDVAFWDNRSTQHYAVADYADAPRVMRRVTIAGDVPRSVSGAESTVERDGTTETWT